VSGCGAAARRAAALVAGALLAAGTPAPAAADGIMLVPAGAFWMGRDEAPGPALRHRVFVRDFWIERHKVTNAEFAAFLEAEGPVAPGGERRYDAGDPDARIHRRPAAGGRAVWTADPGWEHHPAVEVSWFGARDYCRWKGRRLPTEAEWEKAGRGDDRRLRPWGDDPPSPGLAVYARAHGETDRVDARPAGRSPHGVEDLLGNLREWTASALRPYPYRPDDGREPWTGAGEVVVRGASHDDPADALDLTRRLSYPRRGAAAGHHHVGFRCATSEDLGGY
jgi:iron(II)-dependent oxidoreductase